MFVIPQRSSGIFIFRYEKNNHSFNGYAHSEYFVRSATRLGD